MGAEGMWDREKVQSKNATISKHTDTFDEFMRMKRIFFFHLTFFFVFFLLTLC